MGAVAFAFCVVSCEDVTKGMQCLSTLGPSPWACQVVGCLLRSAATTPPPETLHGCCICVMVPGKGVLRRHISAADSCYRITSTSHALHMQAHLCHRTPLLCDQRGHQDFTNLQWLFKQAVSLLLHSPVLIGNVSWLSAWKTMAKREGEDTIQKTFLLCDSRLQMCQKQICSTLVAGQIPRSQKPLKIATNHVFVGRPSRSKDKNKWKCRRITSYFLQTDIPWLQRVSVWRRKVS